MTLCARLLGTAGITPQMPEPLPAQPPINGPLWSLVVPAVLFVVALTATVLLYRHFARRTSD